jgi:hypothetical protein
MKKPGHQEDDRAVQKISRPSLEGMLRNEYWQVSWLSRFSRLPVLVWTVTCGENVILLQAESGLQLRGSFRFERNSLFIPV